MTSSKRLLTNTALVMLGIVLSNATGFLREVVVAAMFGASRPADAFFVAFAIPEFFFLMLPLVIGPALLPLLAERSVRVKTEDVARLLGAVATALALLLTFVAGVAFLAAPFYTPLLAPGFDTTSRELSTRLAQAMMPAILFMGLAAVLSAGLNARRRFFLPALATAGYNVAFVIVALLAGEQIGVRALAWGVLFGSGAALALQVPQVLRLYGQQVARSWHPAATWRFLRLALPLILAFVVHYAATLMDRALASTLPAGTVSALNYSYRTALVAGQLVGITVSTALFPEFAEQASRGDQAQLRQTLTTGLRWILLGGLPATVALTVLRRPVVQLLFQRGAFDDTATATTASLLAWYAWGVFLDALCQPLWRVLYARQEMWTTVGVNGLKTTLRVALDLVLIRVLADEGLAVSFVLGFAFQLLVLVVLVQRRVGQLLTRALGLQTLCIGAASVVGGMVTWLIAERLGGVGPLAATVGGGAMGLVTFAGLAYTLKARLVQ